MAYILIGCGIKINKSVVGREGSYRLGAALAFHCAFWSERVGSSRTKKEKEIDVVSYVFPLLSFVLFLFYFGLGIGRHVGHPVWLMGFCFEALGGANTNMG